MLFEHQAAVVIALNSEVFNQNLIERQTEHAEEHASKTILIEI